MWEKRLLREFLAIAQQALMARLEGRNIPDTRGLLTQLFEMGESCGMSEREITRALLTPAKSALRKGLTRL